MAEQTEKMARAEEIAQGYASQGLNCAECVLQTFLDMHETSLPPEVMAMATGFGGGIGQTKHTCGAVNGAVMALGIVKGRSNPFELETPAERTKQVRSLYPVFAALANEVEETFGTLSCRELTDPASNVMGKVRRKSCRHIVGVCAALTEKYADEAPAAP